MIFLFPTELEAAKLKALRPDLDIRICGIGAVETATAVAQILRTEHQPLLLCGIAGAYDRNLKKGDVVAVTEERFAYLSTGYDRSYLATMVVDGLPMVRSNTVSHCSQPANGAATLGCYDDVILDADAAKVTILLQEVIVYYTFI